jgi:phosphatidate cytidylyltransferase
LDEGDEREGRTDRPRETSEGVRIIGAEEAAEALERGDVAQRRGEGQPRFGDRPQSTHTEGSRPALRFPLGSSSDATDIERGPIASPPGEVVDMQHWTEPATGEVPAVLRPEGEEDLEAWTSFAGAPRWRDEGSQREADDDFADLADLGSDDTRIGALDESERMRSEDWFSFADLESGSGRSVFAEGDDPADPGGEMWGSAEAPADATPPPRPMPRRRGPQHAPTERPPGAPLGGTGQRDMGQAVIVGACILAVALFLFSQGPGWAMLIVLPCIMVAAAELFGALRQAGYQPITIAGLVAVFGMVAGAYDGGEAAIPVVLFLTVVTCLTWYLINAGGDNAVLNTGATLLGVVWVGMLGSYAALMLGLEHTTGKTGIGLLLGAVVGAVAYDVGGLFVGQSMGRSPLSPASPNKTWEGLFGGWVVVLVSCAVFGSAFAPFDGALNGLKLGLVVAVAAPLGDLCQSLVKRDLGIKDMGNALPGHGGFLDRFDGLLFVLPAVWYLARLTDFFS